MHEKWLIYVTVPLKMSDLPSGRHFFSVHIEGSGMIYAQFLIKPQD